MPIYFFIWEDETIEHLAEHEVDLDDFERIVQHSKHHGVSRESGRPIAFGRAADGRVLCCVYEQVDDITIRPITAYEVD